jgi:hypothetical protein
MDNVADKLPKPGQRESAGTEPMSYHEELYENSYHAELYGK